MADEETLGRVKVPFDLTSAAHAVARAAEALNWDFSDPEAFLRRAQHVEYGLSAEIEFAAILRWLGVCKFVHRLNEDRLADSTFTELEVPDLFAVFENAGTRISALIEVKSSEALELKFTRRYLDKLQAYAKQIGQPLLIAWRPRNVGFWVLFDPRIAKTDSEDATVSFDLAIRNDLMGILAGDYSLVAMEGAGLRIVAKRISEKEPTEDGYQAVFEITEAYFHDSAGNKMPEVSAAISSLLLSTLQHDEHIDDDGIVKSFTASDGITKAQLVLRAAVAFPLKDDERIHWRAVSNKLDSILKSADLLAEAKQTFGTFVRYVLFQQPQNRPDFLSSGWTDLFRAETNPTLAIEK